ncbi:hypothetical protein NO1_0733 [Candidatus Termititenax aidoneus]|uniref:Uncharacterized protein n=1 Tax=Termititenax aidoneus TaxID=2218524 RepID=A0A388T9L6_TERA1|nr:hypothetical protein NO1_0733 [Candidatus Termititenax aidoneus]
MPPYNFTLIRVNNIFTFINDRNDYNSKLDFVNKPKEKDLARGRKKFKKYCQQKTGFAAEKQRQNSGSYRL